MKLCRVKLEQAGTENVLTPCVDARMPVRIRTHVLVGVLALTLGVIAGVALVPDFSMP